MRHTTPRIAGALDPRAARIWTVVVGDRSVPEVPVRRSKGPDATSARTASMAAAVPSRGSRQPCARALSTARSPAVRAPGDDGYRHNGSDGRHGRRAQNEIGADPRSSYLLDGAARDSLSWPLPCSEVRVPEPDGTGSARGPPYRPEMRRALDGGFVRGVASAPSRHGADETCLQSRSSGERACA